MRGYMSEGLRPTECFYCWDLEDMAPERLSDRLIKSCDDWAYPYLDDILNHPQNDFSPTYLELMFSSTCNLSCLYCMSDISSKVREEMLQFGPYPVRQSDHRNAEFDQAYEAKDKNPYVQAFWKWFPQIIQTLKYLRITGGEPFLTDELSKIITILNDHPQKDLTFAINSNCSLPYELLRPTLLELKKIKSLEIYASIDAHGVQAEYIRHGLNYSLFLSNIKKIKEEIPHVKIVFMITFSVLSFESFEFLLNDIIELKKQYTNICLDITALKNPEYLRPEIANGLYEDFFCRVKNKLESELFSRHEKEKFLCLKQLIDKSKDNPKICAWKNDFKNFVKEYDKRHGLCFNKCFPTLNEEFL